MVANLNSLALINILWFIALGYIFKLVRCENSSNTDAEPKSPLDQNEWGSSSSDNMHQSSSVLPLAPFSLTQPDLSLVQPFYFAGGYGTFAFQSFWFQAYSIVLVNVFDCFCNGDIYIIFDNGVQVPPDDIDYADGPSTTIPTCQTYLEDIPSCFNNKDFFQIQAAIKTPGFHNITIMVQSLYYTGGGFITGFYTPAVEPGKANLSTNL